MRNIYEVNYMDDKNIDERIKIYVYKRKIIIY